MTPEELLAKYQSVRLNIAALASLYEVNWSSLQHAHGAASDFPILLSAALSQDKRDNEFAFRLLHETIWHQGTIYEATAYAVPFLANLTQSPDVSQQVDFAYLLASIARGKGSFDRDFWSDDDRELWQHVVAHRGKTLDEETAEGRRWTKATRQAVEKYLPVLYPFLKHPISAVRSHIADALPYYPNRKHETIPLLEQSLQVETEKYARESMLEALQKLKPLFE